MIMAALFRGILFFVNENEILQTTKMHVSSFFCLLLLGVERGVMGQNIWCGRTHAAPTWDGRVGYGRRQHGLGRGGGLGRCGRHCRCRDGRYGHGLDGHGVEVGVGPGDLAQMRQVSGGDGRQREHCQQAEGHAQGRGQGDVHARLHVSFCWILVFFTRDENKRVSFYGRWRGEAQ